MLCRNNRARDLAQLICFETIQLRGGPYRPKRDIIAVRERRVNRVGRFLRAARSEYALRRELARNALPAPGTVPFHVRKALGQLSSPFLPLGCVDDLNELV